MELYDIAVRRELRADVTLSEHCLDLVVLCNMSLLELLERELQAIATGEVDLTVGTTAKRRVKLELFSRVVTNCATSHIGIRRCLCRWTILCLLFLKAKNLNKECQSRVGRYFISDATGAIR